MISVVIATYNNEGTLAAVLGALVPAAVDALVREVIIVDAGSTDRTLDIADDAGARILNDADIARACVSAKGEWFLILDARTPPPAGWEDATLDHIRDHPAEAGWWGGAAGLAFWRKPRPKGRLIHRRLYDAIGLLRPGRRMRFGVG